MKTLFRMMALFMLMFTVSACSDDDDEPVVPALEVNYVNLAGTWQLTEWNGKPLPEGTYCYIEFVRRDHTFKMYQKMDSMYARFISGVFEVEQDPYLGSIVSGVYDYENGEWNNDYIVTDLLASGVMTWTVKDNPDDVCKYERCDQVPAEIVAEALAGEE